MRVGRLVAWTVISGALVVGGDRALAQDPASSPPGVGAGPAKPRILTFGCREYWATPGSGMVRRYLHTFRETPTKYGREIVMTEYRDRITATQEGYLNFVESIVIEEIGDHLDFELSARNRKMHITFDGKTVGHVSDWRMGAVAAASLPTEMEDPQVLDDRFPGSLQLILDTWLARKGRTGGDPHPLDGVRFKAIAPRSMTVEEYSFQVESVEPLEVKGGVQIDAVKIALTRVPSEDAPATATRYLWVSGDGELVKWEVPRQGQVHQGELVGFNLKYNPGFAGTRTEKVSLPLPGDKVRAGFYSTDDVLSELRQEAPPKGAAILFLNDADDSGKRVVHRTRIEVAPKGVRIFTLALSGGDEVDSGAVRDALDYLKARADVDEKRILLLSCGSATPMALRALGWKEFAGWILVNAVLPEAPVEDLVETVRDLSIPVLVIYGDAGDPTGVTKRRELAQRVGEAGDSVEIVSLTDVDEDLRFVSEDPVVREEPAPGYLRALARWFRRHAFGR